MLPRTRLRPDFPALREANARGSFEGQTSAGIGLTQRVGFRVLELTNPSRIAIDLTHPLTAVVVSKGVGWSSRPAAARSAPR